MYVYRRYKRASVREARLSHHRIEERNATALKCYWHVNCFARPWPALRNSGPESFSRAGVCLGSLLRPVFRCRVGFERTKKATRRACNLFHRAQEQRFVCLGGFVESAYLPDELECRSSNLFFRARRIKIVERFNIPAHVLHQTLTSKPLN